MSDVDMIGKLVRWECDGQWLTARVTGYDGGSGRGSLTGVVVDPGTSSVSRRTSPRRCCGPVMPSRTFGAT